MEKWTRKEYGTWDEAFRGLTPRIRQSSVRIASYTRELFVQACADSFAKGTHDGSARIRGKYADLAYKCGMYHQLGKALVPPEYQIFQSDFTDEEKSVYWKYMTDGRTLVSILQERGAAAKRKRGMPDGEEAPTDNITWLMLREACEQHMERWDGTGLPEGRRGDEISPVAQIVGLAHELDRLASETKSEKPFDEALEKLKGEVGAAWSPALIDVLTHAEEACRGVYKKYIHYTMTLPETIPLVEKREDRPMGLKYRPMVSDKNGSVSYYEAIPWYGGIADNPDETESTEDVSELLKKSELISDISVYFMYEAADAVLRLENCKLDVSGIILNVPANFYSESEQLFRINQVFEDEGISKDKLLFTIPESVLLSADRETAENVIEYLNAGCKLVLDGYHPDKISTEQLRELGFSMIRMSPELNLKSETAVQIKSLRESGFTLIGGAADSQNSLAWQLACGVVAVGGPVVGALACENEMIRDGLVREQTI